MFNRNKTNLIVDFLLFLNLALLAGIGLLIKYALPPGRERILKYGNNMELVFLSWDRHQWGAFHLLLGYVLIGLLVLHIVLHWKTVVCLVRQAVPLLWLRRLLTTGCVILAALFFLLPFIINPEQISDNDFLHRNAGAGQDSKAAAIKFVLNNPQVETGKPADNDSLHETSTPTKKNGPAQARHELVRENHHTEHGEASLQGRMTIAQVSRLYGISTSLVKKRLAVPDHVSDQETLGRLRRSYGFTMEQARTRLEAK